MPVRRRRKKKNPLLMRILVVSVVAHLIGVPIVAYFGGFKKIQQSFSPTRIVSFTTSAPSAPPPEKPKEAAKPEEKEKGKGDDKSAKKQATAGVDQPKVVTAGPGTGTGDGGPSAVSGTGVAGGLPQPQKPATKSDAPSTGTAAPPKPPVADRATPAKPTEPEKKNEPPVITPVAPPKPKKVLEAVAVETPQPEIPDDLRSEPLDKELVVEAEISKEGKPEGVSVAHSTGIDELDQIGLDTARKYRFRPATVDGEPVAQHVRFRIQFKVD